MRRGTLPLKRYFHHVGLIRRASGTRSPDTLADIIASLESLHAEGQMELLERVRDGELRPIDVLVRHRYVEAKPKPQSQTFIYVIRANPSGKLKIGIATNVAERLADLQLPTWETLDLVVATTGNREDEQNLHHRFRSHRIRGEWFHPAPEILKWTSEALEEQAADGHT